jgi:hypothetical protein
MIVVVVASSCLLLGSSVRSLSELYGVLRMPHARMLNGVSLLCDALRLQPVVHKRRGVVLAAHDLLATPSTQVVSVRCVVSDACCSWIMSMVQCHCMAHMRHGVVSAAHDLYGQRARG